MATHLETAAGLSLSQRAVKRSLDVLLAAAGLALLGWLIALAYLLASIDTGSNGFFLQDRVGYKGRIFRLIKLKTMRDDAVLRTNVTTARDRRITRLGRFWRKSKIDELPQLLNILAGHMSFVGPRPDVPGYADKLEGEDRMILQVRPGITGPASLKYRNEENLLAGLTDPEKYNDEVIFPDKVRINKEYVANYSLLKDLKYIYKTIKGRSKNKTVIKS
jgi:lipopolysaccharide/colanic/teichoic acid biosynthesis glycosyltransferase